MTAEEIKALGSCWGSQSGLLSVAELRHLMGLVREAPQPRGEPLWVLEVGHYMGLSTCALVHALVARPSQDWQLVTLDAHCRDGWVPESDPAHFLENKARYFDTPQVAVVLGRSEELRTPLPYHVVFYDGDHADEQERFTRLVLDSPQVRLFVFDDRDFAVPSRCMALMQAAGWEDHSLALARLPKDKTNPETMTLGVWRRGGDDGW